MVGLTRMSAPESTSSEDSVPRAESKSGRAPYLFLVLQAHQPLGRGARYSLEGVDLVVIRRGGQHSAAQSERGQGRARGVRTCAIHVDPAR
jgi:hypothetical protein